MKKVVEFLHANPEIEVTVTSPEYAWIRLHGKAVFENNMAIKEICIQNPTVKSQYQTAENPVLEVFHIAIKIEIVWNKKYQEHKA